MSRNGGHAARSTRYPIPTIVPRTVRRGLRLQDPAYVADTPHDMWYAMQRSERFRSTRSAEELEAWVRAAPELEATLQRGTLQRERYDDLGRLLAKAILEHYGRHPQDVRLTEVLQREVRKDHPRLTAEVSTPQWLWALAAAGRIWDAHQLG